MKTIELALVPLALSSLLGGCAVYEPPVAYEPQPYYQTAPAYAQPTYVAPPPVYVQPPVRFGFNFGSRGGHRHRWGHERWHGGHHH